MQILSTDIAVSACLDEGYRSQNMSQRPGLPQLQPTGRITLSLFESSPTIARLRLFNVRPSPSRDPPACLQEDEPHDGSRSIEGPLGHSHTFQNVSSTCFSRLRISAHLHRMDALT